MIVACLLVTDTANKAREIRKGNQANDRIHATHPHRRLVGLRLTVVLPRGLQFGEARSITWRHHYLAFV